MIDMNTHACFSVPVDEPPRPTYDEIWALLNRIYIARNISLNEEVIHESLRQIDKWLAEPSVGN